MAKFAPVAPAHIVERLPVATMGSYHLLLAHDVVKQPDVYSRVYNHFGMTTIMDNSVVELGEAVNPDIIKEAVHITGVSTIVLPDVLRNCDKTIDSIFEAHPIWLKFFERQLGIGREWGFMYVPQGLSIEEFVRCAEASLELDRVNFWGIPRNLVREIGTRERAIYVCRALAPERRIHLLGFSDNIIDDVGCSRIRGVEGIDSAVPLRLASLGLPMSMVAVTPPRGDWWDHAQYLPSMAANIETFRRWIRPQ